MAASSPRQIPLTQYVCVPAQSASLPGGIGVLLVIGALYFAHVFSSGLEKANQQATLQAHLAQQLPIKAILGDGGVQEIIQKDNLPLKRVRSVIVDLERGNFAKALEGIHGRGFPRVTATETLAAKLSLLSEQDRILQNAETADRGLELKATALAESLIALQKDMYKMFRNPNYINASADATESDSGAQLSIPDPMTAQFYAGGVLQNLPLLPWLPEGLSSYPELEPFLRSQPQTAGGDPAYWTSVEANINALRNRADDLHARIASWQKEGESIAAKNENARKELTSAANETVLIAKQIYFELAAPQPTAEELRLYGEVSKFLERRLGYKLPPLASFE